MKTRITVLLIITHLTIGAIGYGIGIYMLPILIAPPAPSAEKVKLISSQARYTAEFKKDLKDSDTLHWGEGNVSIGSKHITLLGQLAPGPDYKLYLSEKFVETEKEFLQLKSSMVQVGTVNTFKNFIIKVPPEIKPANYKSVIIWCEAFSQFITAASYQ